MEEDQWTFIPRECPKHIQVAEERERTRRIKEKTKVLKQRVVFRPIHDELLKKHPPIETTLKYRTNEALEKMEEWSHSNPSLKSKTAETKDALIHNVTDLAHAIKEKIGLGAHREIIKTGVKKIEGESEPWKWTLRTCPKEILEAEENERKRRIADKPSDAKMLELKRKMHEELLKKRPPSVESTIGLNILEKVGHTITETITMVPRGIGRSISQSLKEKMGMGPVKCGVKIYEGESEPWTWTLRTCPKEIIEAEEKERQRRMALKLSEMSHMFALKKRMFEELLKKRPPVEPASGYVSSIVSSVSKVGHTLYAVKPIIEEKVQVVSDTITHRGNELGDNLTKSLKEKMGMGPIKCGLKMYEGESEPWTWTLRKCPKEIREAEERERKRRIKDKSFDPKTLELKKQLHEELLTKIHPVGARVARLTHSFMQNVSDIAGTLKRVRHTSSELSIAQLNKLEEQERQRRLKDYKIDVDVLQQKQRVGKELLQRVEAAH